ncbi:hypothetical protein [Prosthecobacter sp.]|uniref:hypothetical protein n=1 Tax=Prosthecobacter sp. TaxID=1965333 RepID=UPI002AB9238E|nr:hypothetical protein [Prosthecobacter sp.]MDZ4405844.1 hypothetical protein [Prosthecobacter sp.]
MKRELQAIAVLLVFGVAKLPLEEHVTQDLRKQKMLDEPIRLGVGENLGQAGIAASLGGLRGLAASMFQLRAHLEFTHVNWAKVDSLYKLVTRLQPRNVRYWEEASWHMAYNAASYYLYNQELKPALRGQLFHDHVMRGVAILEEGLKFLPDHPRLWQKLGDTHWHRSKDFKQAGDAYWNSFQHGGLNFTERFAGFAYAQSNDPDSWRKGYAILKRHYDANKATPGLVEFLKLLEQNLHIPTEQRIPDAAPVRKVPEPQTGPQR